MRVRIRQEDHLRSGSVLLQSLCFPEAFHQAESHCFSA